MSRPDDPFPRHSWTGQDEMAQRQQPRPVKGRAPRSVTTSSRLVRRRVVRRSRGGVGGLRAPRALAAGRLAPTTVSVLAATGMATVGEADGVAVDVEKGARGDEEEADDEADDEADLGVYVLDGVVGELAAPQEGGRDDAGTRARDMHDGGVDLRHQALAVALSTPTARRGLGEEEEDEERRRRARGG